MASRVKLGFPGRSFKLAGAIHVLLMTKIGFAMLARILFPILLTFFPLVILKAADQIAVWVNSGEDKVAQQEQRLTEGKRDLRNSVWDGQTVQLRSARNETVSFNVILEAADAGLNQVHVRFDKLTGDGGTIASQSVPKTTSKRDAGEALFDYRQRQIELFYVRYLTIKGCSILAYEHYDERHVPERFRRPHNDNGVAKGDWTDRPDHDRSYPDIAVPIEFYRGFAVKPKLSQSIWCDIYVPNDTPPGEYTGVVSIEADAMEPRTIPVQLLVKDWTLPELPSAKTMLYVSQEDINQRYIGRPYLDDAPVDVIARSRKIVDRHFQMAHRHRISLIHEHTPLEQMGSIWQARLDGSLFTPPNGYEGPGKNVGNNVHSIGTYGSWDWKDAADPKQAIWKNTDEWINYFNQQKFETPTEKFLYVADESDQYETLEQLASWVKTNPGPGGQLKTLVTLPLPKAMQKTPSLTLPCSTVAFGETMKWNTAVEHYRQAEDKSFYLYNGGRPGSGTMVIEDDGIAMRQLAWCQFKFQVPRWFVWSGTYYKNYQGTGEDTRLFSQAHTFGGRTGVSESLGETGWNYNNGDGVLFYPGTDQIYAKENYGVDGPFASLRLKHWRRGLQDYEYLQAAAEVNPVKTQQIVRRMIPRVLWEVTIDDPNDPSYARSDISWSTDPDDWRAARSELAEIIGRASATAK